MSDFVALIVKFMVVISVTDYTMMDTGGKVDHLLEVVDDVKIPVDTAQVRANVLSWFRYIGHSILIRDF